ncbi:pentatricopeptide repeat domain-containing protein [Spizellomyces punctatus DAOM BR117]|uniref:Pentatricopeptide repeat domain-containing protein n=1 Tax=Spizellomyces punctatus (strain DAOM BR117) TaxID=645134 RepID=A0A0L0HRR5_SPIPD|nr:pentatricopeptide repeat domain-containing protein [Spizellomyces punctatus DAOM BR117]KND03808.1 pentatricopeptide repeat domain-containing protein [Spizellomyces punctatus DAOM BR117]|eukprot:XP_016611847.1 pentatricopeptide repeat domain-containing protein [Spizellomyces punctatus DAOM BR117]
MFHTIARRLAQPVAQASRRCPTVRHPATTPSCFLRKQHTNSAPEQQLSVIKESTASSGAESSKDAVASVRSILREYIDKPIPQSPNDSRPHFTPDQFVKYVRQQDHRLAWDAYKYLERNDNLKEIGLDVFNGFLRLIRSHTLSWGARLTKESRIRTAEGIIATMRKNGLEPNTPTYVALASYYAYAGQVKKVQKIWKIMAERGWNLPRVAPFILLTAKAWDRPTDALKELEDSVGRYPIAQLSGPYNALLEHAVQLKQDDLVQRVLLFGKDNGFLPDGRTYDILIEYFASSKGDIEEARKLVYKKLENGYGRTTRSYNSLLRGFLRANRVLEADKILREMETHGVPANTVTYNLMLTAYWHQRDPIAAMRMYISMLVKRVGPNRNTHAALSKSVGMYTAGLRNLIERAGAFPSPALYKGILEGFLEDKEYRQAIALLREYRKEHKRNSHRWPMTVDILKLELSCLSKLGRGEDAESTFEEISTQAESGADFYSYNAVISAFSKAPHKNPEKAAYYLDRMKKAGLEPDQYTYNGLIYSVWDAGKPLNQQALDYVREYVQTRKEAPGKLHPTDGITRVLQIIGEGDQLKGFQIVASGQTIDLTKLAPIDPEPQDEPQEGKALLDAFSEKKVSVDEDLWRAAG